jgi:hypothetical protein
MRQIQTTLDRIATLAALRLLVWVGKHVDPAQQLWLAALRAELDAIDGGLARLVWAVGGLRLVWFQRRRHIVNATYRYGPVLLPGLEAALFVGLTWSLIRHYGSLAVILLVLAGLGLVVAIPVLIALVHAIRAIVTTKWVALHEPLRRVRPPLPFVLSVISLATLLVLLLSAPTVLNQLLAQQGLATAGVVVRSADHRTAEAVFDQTGSFSHAEVYLTTQVKPLAVNGVPLVQLLQSGRPDRYLGLHNDLQALIDKFTGIQGYDLAHGQFPDGAGMGFAPEWGHGGTGPDGTGPGPWGRPLDAHDARTFNVWIPRDFGGLSYLTYNDDTITVQSLATGQRFDLHVVGEYEPDGSARTPLFGRVLADDSAVQALSGGQPLYAYGLHLDGNQIPMVFAHLHIRVPTAQLYNFLTGPTGSDTRPAYALFTDPDPTSAFGDNNVPPSPLFGEIVVFWAGLLAVIIVLNREARARISQRGLGNRRKG